MSDASNHPKKVVVGVDGSEASLAALDWAMRQAELTGSGVEAVTAWRWPSSFGGPLPLIPDYNPEAEATKTVVAAIAKVRPAHPAIEVRVHVAQGGPAQVLVDASKGAELLVVGNRGFGELAGMLLGSVSEYCVTHAHCPVLVLRH
ncbi:MAG TPA: universal stress protein [Acidimicrobiales bacterium]|nr:universal stress protein [Acidimicrobiales bacterium]